MMKRILSLCVVLVLVAVLAVPMAAMASNQAGQGASTEFVTTILIKDQLYTDDVSTITFPAGALGATISLPTNGVGGQVQTFSSTPGSALPVVTLVYTGTALNIWYNITTWSPASVVESEAYVILTKGAACADAAAIDNAVTFDTDTVDVDGTAIGSDAGGTDPTQKDLYLKITLASTGGGTATSTLTILGEEP